MTTEVEAVLEAWRLTATTVAATPAEFLGRDKETKFFRRLRQDIESLALDLLHLS